VIHKIVVMGVAGCGKSTLATRLACALGCEAIEGDDYHLAANLAKMAAGMPLDDADRWPWLDRLGQELQGRAGHAVLSCSALKRCYRDLLRGAVPGLRFVYVDITPRQAAERVAARPGHVFPASLVASQFQALEPPLGEPGVLRVDACAATASQVDAILDWLAAVPASPLVAS
jgi:gluconokinase